MLSPTVLSFSPVAGIFYKATADLSAAYSRFFSAFSVSIISRCSASYCTCMMSSLARSVLPGQALRSYPHPLAETGYS
ncbi:hypothetical protein [Clostridium estertheticum]|uniref:hypothetical protein n=1 Tax=Clostridium estertheticum TaxID=238834 RepID=UPI001C0BCD44|nr:hypothetical protein [Clostridium estertheticum]MBU3075594.1 hypothetical protein [Clostridium estertheticum]MBU3164824.1 hypothetical protein [Clostridium estertheticum]